VAIFVNKIRHEIILVKIENRLKPEIEEYGLKIK